MIETLWLSWDEQQALLSYARDFGPVDDRSLHAAVPTMTQALPHLLAKDSLQILAGFMAGPGNILRINGLATDENPPSTPYSGYVDNADLPIATVMQSLVFAACQLAPIAYERENRGLLLRHVVPTRKREMKVSSHGSRYTLDMHVSNPILPIIPEPTHGVSASPEVLSFYGVRQDPNVYTEVVELDEVLALIDPAVIEQLRQPAYYFRMPSSFGGDELQGPFPVLAQRDGMYYNRTDMDTVIPVDYSALLALTAFMKATRQVPNYHRLQLAPGEMLVFKNQRTLHSRQKFLARYNGLDRWMVRLYGTSDLSRHHPADAAVPYVGVTY